VLTLILKNGWIISEAAQDQLAGSMWPTCHKSDSLVYVIFIRIFSVRLVC
jgi:hypothetical protein